MPEIKTLVRDIQDLIRNKKDGWFNEELSTHLARNISGALSEQLGEPRKAPTLRLSQMGPKCPRALWYSIHHPELAEPLPPWAEIKFSIGHIVEALAIALAKAAGHSVVGEQDEITLDGVTGHRDCVIDGCIVDVKSAASRSFEKFKDGSLAQSDSFGYLDQLDGYVVGSYDDPLVTNKDYGYLLAIDKQLGHMCLYEHPVREVSIRNRIRDYKRIVELSNPPECECGTVPDGKSGNEMLDLRASYNAYKYACFPHLRTFLYAGGPRYLTKVVKRPMNANGPIPEIDRHGKFVYH